jgi:hypothetical protein
MPTTPMSTLPCLARTNLRTPRGHRLLGPIGYPTIHPVDPAHTKARHSIRIRVATKVRRDNVQATLDTLDSSTTKTRTRRVGIGCNSSCRSGSRRNSRQGRPTIRATSKNSPTKCTPSNVPSQTVRQGRTPTSRCSAAACPVDQVHPSVWGLRELGVDPVEEE